MLSHWSLAVPMCRRPSDYKQGFSWASTSSTPRKPLEVPFEDLQDPKFNRGLPRRLICEWPRKSFLAVIKANPREAIFDWNMWMDQSFSSAENTACDSKIVSDTPQTQRSFPKRRPFVITTSGKKIYTILSHQVQSRPHCFVLAKTFFEFPGVYVTCELFLLMITLLNIIQSMLNKAFVLFSSCHRDCLE